MITIRRLIYREVIAAVAFVALGFLALFFFFDFVDGTGARSSSPSASSSASAPCRARDTCRFSVYWTCTATSAPGCARRPTVS
jgi:hypothetical protein